MDDAEIIYLEADAEITDAIDKLKNAKGDAVKIVVPARSSLLQSAVNLKLLKKAAKDHGKEMALVTNDKTAQYLAGGVGLAVAASLKSEPRIPEGVKEDVRPDIVEPDPDEKLPATAEKPSKSSESSSKDSKSSSKDKDGKSKSSEAAEEAVIAKRAIGEGYDDDAVGAEELAQKKAKAKVPNYSAFQKKLLAGAGVLVAVLVAAGLFITLPTAKLTIIARADKLAINSPFVLDAASTQSDPSSLTYAGQKATLQKDLTQNFNATGKKDVGTKATGNVTISNCSNSDSFTIPAGTVLSSQGKNFALNAEAAVPGAKFSGGNCSKAGTVGGAITATANGDAYNLGSTTFAIAGFDAKVTASGSTAGGTSKTVTVVTQADVDGARQQAVDAAANASKDELLAKVDKQDVVFEDTLATAITSVSSSAPVDSEAANGTVTVKATYSVFAATKDTMHSLLDTLAKDAMPKGDQQLYQNGIDDAKYSLVKTVSDMRVQLNVVTSAYYGQKIDKQQIAKDTAGKSKKSVTSIVQQDNPSVEKTLVESSPSLVPNMPMLSSRITVIIKVSTD